MARIVKIQDGIAQVIDETIVAQAALPDIVKHLQTQTPTLMPILPMGTRIIAYDPDNARVRLIVQVPPEIVGFRVHFDDAYNRMPKEDRKKADRNGYNTFQLRFPWAIHYFGAKVNTGKDEIAQEGYGKNRHETLQGFTIDETGYYWSDKPITSMEQYIFPAHMLNINNKGGICWGSSTGPTSSLAERLDGLVKNFYSTQYNDHYGYRVPPKYKTYSEWEADNDPLAYLEWPMWDIKKNPEGITVARRMQTSMDMSQVWATSVVGAPPTSYTPARLIEWFNSIPEHDRTRFIVAASALAKNLDVQDVLGSIDWNSFAQRTEPEKITKKATKAAVALA